MGGPARPPIFSGARGRPGVQNLSIETLVQNGLWPPREIALHARELEICPRIGIAVEPGAKLHSLDQTWLIDASHENASRDSSGNASIVRVNDGVRQSAHAADDRYAAIALAVELGQSARLESRWYKDRVGAALQQVRELLVIADEATATS